MKMIYSTIPYRICQPRTLAIRRDVGRWIGEPQHIYDRIADEFYEQQVKIDELWWDDSDEGFLGFFKCNLAWLTNHPA